MKHFDFDLDTTQEGNRKQEDLGKVQQLYPQCVPSYELPMACTSGRSLKKYCGDTWYTDKPLEIKWKK